MAVILDFRSERVLLFFIYKSPQCYLPSFKSVGILVQEKNRKYRFFRWRPLGFLIGMILTIFDLQITRRFLPSFKSVDLLVQEKKRKNRFSRWRRPSQISDRKELSYFSSSRHFKASYQVSSQSAQCVGGVGF